MGDTRHHFVFCSRFLLLLLYSSTEEGIFVSVQGLLEQADDFCLCFEKGLTRCLLPYNGSLQWFRFIRIIAEILGFPINKIMNLNILTFQKRQNVPETTDCLKK